MRTPIVTGNWKCHKTATEAVELARQLAARFPARGTPSPARMVPARSRASLDGMQDVEVVVCPPFTALSAAAEALRGSTIGLGAQDVFWEPSGAFTGEIAAPMLVELGCRFCIVGHSERRQYFGDTDDAVNRKLRALLAAGLTPIVCIGETLPQREQGETFDVLRRQLEGALTSLAAPEGQRLVIAYEPVWAIGTGRNATAAQAQEAQAFIRRRLEGMWTAQAAGQVRIQYGGSVNAANALELLQQADVDGALVGGASLQADSFVAIVKAASEAKLARR